MIFNSYLFILLFLPVVILGYYFIGNSCRYKFALFFLLVASMVFYGYASIRYLILLAANIIANYFIYQCLQKNRIRLEKWRKLILVIGIVINFTVLLYFKYYNFLIDNVNMLLKTNLGIRNIILPLGISFITFQQIAFLVDTYHGKTPDYSLLYYALFVSFFPHISSGPIILHNDFMPLLNKEKREINWDKLASGIYQFAMGLGKKVLVADMFAEAVNWGYANVAELNSSSALFVSVAYSMQIYFDFSGYSDMAIGISRMLQLDLPINFNSPYKADTILEFWDRWHITLTRFFSRYVYIPLGGNRRGKVRTYLNTMIVFLFSGLWHGASWSFILWGGLHGCFMIVTKHFKGIFDKIPRFMNKAITLLFVNFCWILFRAESLGVFRQMMKAIFQRQWGGLNEDLCEFFKIPFLDNIVVSELPDWLGAMVILLGAVWITLGCRNVQERIEHLKYSALSCVWAVVIAILSILSFSGVNIFIYAYF